MTIQNFFMLMSIMVAAGIFGGVVATALDERNETLIKELIRNSIVGVAAAVLVPLFLNMISSDIVENSVTEPSELLIFIGFCVIAAIYSKKFIRTVSEKVLKDEIDRVESSVDEIKKEQTIDRFYKDSLFHIHNKNFDLAFRALDEWIAFDKDTSRPYLGKAKALKDMKKYEEAIEMTTRAIGFKDKYEFKGYYNRACYKAKSGAYDIQSVLSDLKSAINLHPVYKEYAKDDEDLTSLHSNPAFLELLA